ncbi:methylosome protein 50 [Octopus bimaculoides]|uniref:methylosome protein 50 n=1 Tax=Octopus bimaculoides TaxID=37653 RepID=UPI0022E0F4D5|nr:methylosome protein 50 [Octopus bimaculoides]
MDQIPAVMDRHLDVIQHRKEGGILLGASSLTGRYWYGSLWFYEIAAHGPDVEKCTAGVQLEAGIDDAIWIDQDKTLIGLDTGGIAVWQLVDNYKTFVQMSASVEHDSIVTTVSSFADSKKVLSASHDKSVKIWDLETLNTTTTYRAHSSIVWSAQCHPTESEQFASCSQDGRVLFWDTRKSRPAAIIDKYPLSSNPTACAWQPGEKHKVAVGDEDGRIIVKDVRKLQDMPVSSYKPHYRPVHRLQFSPQNSNIIASISEDCSLVVGYVAENSICQIFKNTSHQDFVQGLSWSCGTEIFTCGWDSLVLTHDLSKLKELQQISTLKVEVNGNNQLKTERFEKTECCEEKISVLAPNAIEAN